MVIAKKDKEDHILPLEVHLSDAAGVAEFLLERVVTEAEIRACGFTRDEFKKLIIFIVSVHDIGKDTAFFTSMIINGLRAETLALIRETIRPVPRLSDYLNPYKVHHSYAGEEILADRDAKIMVDKSIVVIIGAHHGIPYSKSGSSRRLMDIYRKNFIGDDRDKTSWRSGWDEITEMAVARSGIDSGLLQKSLTPAAQVILAGYVTWADWIASNTDFFPLMDVEGALSFEKSGAQEKDRILRRRVSGAERKLFFLNRWRPGVTQMGDDMFYDRFGFMPNGLQKTIINAGSSVSSRGLCIVESETGSGKTEASIAAATVLASKFGCGGIFYALPTQASSNAMFSRLIRWAEKEGSDTALSVRLAHSAAHLNEDFEDLYHYGASDTGSGGFESAGIGAYPLFNGNKKALLSNFVIGTVDQFLMCALKKKHVFLRHIGIAGKVLIIDECHAYDAYMDSRFEDALKWAGYLGVPVVLLSATLPDKKREDFLIAYMTGMAEAEGKSFRKKDIKNSLGLRDVYPLITWTDGLNVYQKEIPYAKKTKKVKITKKNGFAAVAGYITEKLSKGGCAEFIANTVGDAQKMFRLLKEDGRFKVLLCHSLYTDTDRPEKENTVLRLLGKDSKAEDRDKVIVVGTQLLEQSIDTDADIMATQPCPADSKVQRIGRLFRHERPDRPENLTEPECVLWMDEDGGIQEGTKHIYFEYPVAKTLEAIGDSVAVPDDIPKLINKVYDADLFADRKEACGNGSLAQYLNAVMDKRTRAKESFALDLPDDTIEDLLVNMDCLPEGTGASLTRDIGDTVETIILAKAGDGTVTPAGSAKGKYYLRMDEEPEMRYAKAVAREKLRLPGIFSAAGNISSTIRELEASTAQFSAWQGSKLLKGTFILLLDENGDGRLCGKDVHYDHDEGFSYSRGTV